MKLKFRRFGAATAAAAIGVAGMLTMAEPAAASYSDCPTNRVCLWSGINGTGSLLFAGSGTEMHDQGGFWTTDELWDAGVARSASNTTLGRFCTYTRSNAMTNILNPGTKGNLANVHVSLVSKC